LNLDVLDGDGLDGTQVALGCKFEKVRDQQQMFFLCASCLRKFQFVCRLKVTILFHSGLGFRSYREKIK
jgi:hypothetical protein